MPVSNIVGSSASLIPSFEHPRRETRTTEQSGVVSQVAVSIPGNDERTVSEEREPDRVTAEITGTYNRRLQFVVDHNSSEVIVKVIDNATDEVVRVLPPEELQRLRSPQETMGSLLSERV